MIMRQEIEDTIIRLLKKDEFFANLLFLVDKVYDDKIGTAGVGFVGSKLTLFVSPKFFNNNTPKFQEEVLIHECEHVIKGHLTSIRNKEYDKKRYNIACDIQINEPLRELHQIGQTADRYGFEKNLLSDQYYDLLKDNEDLGEGHDNHDNWESELGQDVVDATIKEALEKAIDSTKNKGSIPGSVVDTLDKIKKKAEIPWRSQLRRYIGKLASVNQRTTRMRKNRRFGWQYAGVRTENNKLKIVVCLDTSGSVSDNMLKHFFCEVDKIHSEGHEINILEIDSKVQNVDSKPYKPKSKFVVHGRGGTLYQPALDKCRQMECDIIVFCGDGGCFDKPKDVGIPVIWVLGRGQTIDVNFGKKVNVNVE